MALSDYIDESKRVPFTGKANAGKGFDVFPISLSDIVGIVERHRPDIDAVIARSRANGEPLDGFTLLRQYPELCIDVIATATREVEDWGTVVVAEPQEGDDPRVKRSDVAAQIRRLPLGVQLLALTTVWELAEIDVGALGNVIAAVTKDVMTVAALLPDEAPSTSGLTASPSTSKA